MINVYTNRMTDQEKRGHPIRKALTAGALAAGAAAAGYYFYGSKNAKQHRQQAARWAQTVKKDALRQIDRAKKIDRAAVMAAIDRAAKEARRLSGVDKKSVNQLVRELKQHWSKLATEAAKTAKGSVRSAKKVVRRAALRRG